MSPSNLRGTESATITATPNLPGQVLQVWAPGTFDLDLSGNYGSVDGMVEAGAPGSVRPVFEIGGGPENPSAHIRAWLDTSNRFFAEITDAAGVVVATSDAASGSLPMGFGISFRLAWSCLGGLPPILMSNYESAYVDVDGTRPDWAIVSSTWLPWRARKLRVGSFSGSSTSFNGIIRRIAVSTLPDPDAEVRTWSLPAEPPPPNLVGAAILHLGDLSLSGSNMLSSLGHTTGVTLTGTGAVSLSQVDILGAGGVIGPDSIVVPASLIPGIDGGTDAMVKANGYDSGVVRCTLPVDPPTISDAAIGFDASLNIAGTYFLSRTPSVSSVDVIGTGAVTLTRAQVLAGGGTWTDSAIFVPAALVPGIDDTSTCDVTSNAQTSAPHAIAWPAPAPAVTSADIAHLGGLAIAGTDLLSTAPASNSVVITGDGAVTLTKAQILAAMGTFTATSISIPASLVPGITDSSDVMVHANLQDSNVQGCALPSDAPTITAAAIQTGTLDLQVDGTNFLSRTPSVSSIDITAPGAVNLTQSDVETGGGAWTDTQVYIPAALIPGINNTSTCAITANAQTTAYSPITGP